MVTTYYLDGAYVLYETDGTNDIYYSYDVDGTLISLNVNGIEYFYIYNIFGDVSYLVDTSGVTVVEYRYDAFGNITYQTPGTLSELNPYRYRGYRYDVESGLYYLQSRYYNPETGRFINADGLLKASNTVLGHNMFSYTENNPVNFVDFGGYCYDWTDEDGDGDRNDQQDDGGCGSGGNQSVNGEVTSSQTSSSGSSSGYTVVKVAPVDNPGMKVEWVHPEFSTAKGNEGKPSNANQELHWTIVKQYGNSFVYLEDGTYFTTTTIKHDMRNFIFGPKWDKVVSVMWGPDGVHLSSMHFDYHQTDNFYTDAKFKW
ncbi:MAG: RHS repeat-associated core domain-containing protein [Candidatus Izemoplasmatales bacterium]